MRLIVSAILLSVIMVATASAEFLVPAYKEAKKIEKKWALSRIYINGLGVGVSWMNAEAKLYCPPEDLAMNDTDILIGLIDDELERLEKLFSDDVEGQEMIKEMPVVYVLIRGLKSTYPCEKKKEGK